MGVYCSDSYLNEINFLKGKRKKHHQVLNTSSSGGRGKEGKRRRGKGGENEGNYLKTSYNLLGDAEESCYKRLVTSFIDVLFLRCHH